MTRSMLPELPDHTANCSGTLAMPADTNPSGDIFGGWLMSQMDMAGADGRYPDAEP